jgi:cholesterol oxidase
LGRSDQFCLPTLAVHFGDPDRLRPNKFGKAQYGCRHCGECDIGCNYQAKNTLDLNYLAVAQQHGADVGTQCEVTRIERTGATYQVTFTNHVTGTERVVRAPVVVLGAGAVNTTELLLRCRDQYRTLPVTSDLVGHGYSGNGDFLAFAVQTAQPCDPWVGPTITTGMVYDRGSDWFIFEEGGAPQRITGLITLLARADSRFAGDLRVWQEGLDMLRRSAQDHLGPDVDGATDSRNTAVFLAMGRDSADGRIELLPGTHETRVTWRLRENLGLYRTEQRLCADVAKALGGRAVYNPLWSALRLPVAVHNLGGCGMADDAAHGVVDGNGEVFGCPNLYVFDGSCLPSATGVNPSHTIAAVAERNVETAIRKITGEHRWVAPERAQARPVVDPLAALRIPAGGTKPPRTPDIGLTCTGSLRGTVTRGQTNPAKVNGRPGGPMSVRLDVAVPSVADFLDDPRHRCAAVGVVAFDGLTGPDGARIGGGVIDLLVPGDTGATRQVRYTLPFFGVDGKPYLLDGCQEIQSHAWWDLWRDNTSVLVRVRAGHQLRGRIVAAGRLWLSPGDVVRELVTVRITGTRNPISGARALTDVGLLVAGSCWDVFVRPRIPFLSTKPGEPDADSKQAPEKVTDAGGRRPQGRVPGRRAAGVAGRGRAAVRSR